MIYLYFEIMREPLVSVYAFLAGPPEPGQQHQNLKFTNLKQHERCMKKLFFN